MDCTYKGVGGWEGDGVGGGAGGQLKMGYSFQQDCLEFLCVQEVLVISPGKTGGLKRRLTNAAVNIKQIPPTCCPPWAPLSQP